jgi:hypothetical protein
MSNPNAVAPEGVRSWTLQDHFDRFCGVVYLHCQDPTFDTSFLQCVVISRTAYGQHNTSAEDPPLDDCDVVSIREQFAERQQLRKDSDERSASNYWDMYDSELKWQAYDVLAVSFKADGVAERVGVGMCLVDAFWGARPERRKISIK